MIPNFFLSSLGAKPRTINFFQIDRLEREEKTSEHQNAPQCCGESQSQTGVVSLAK